METRSLEEMKWGIEAYQDQDGIGHLKVTGENGPLFVDREVSEYIKNKLPKFGIGLGTRIEPNVKISAGNLRIGIESVIRSGCVIRGTLILLGKSFYLNKDCEIGGGSCFNEKHSALMVGDWFQGHECHINIARQVTIDDCVGFGRGTKVYTHGAHLSVAHGFPAAWGQVDIGKNVWLPGAIVNPGVSIGSNVVVGVGSVVTKRLKGGHLYAGSPAKRIGEDEPKRYTGELIPVDVLRQNINSILEGIPGNHIAYRSHLDDEYKLSFDGDTTVFNIKDQTITGASTDETELIREELRRNGIRFRVWNPNNVRRLGGAGDQYVSWSYKTSALGFENV